MKQTQNIFYCTVCKAKREYWLNFLRGIKPSNLTQIRPENRNRYWIVLKYTKPKLNNTTPALVGPNKEIAVTMQDKKALVRLHAFLPLPIFHRIKYKLENGMAHILITKNSVRKAFLCQFIKKAPRLNMHNFQILCIL